MLLFAFLFLFLNWPPWSYFPDVWWRAKTSSLGTSSTQGTCYIATTLTWPSAHSRISGMRTPISFLSTLFLELFLSLIYPHLCHLSPLWLKSLARLILNTTNEDAPNERVTHFKETLTLKVMWIIPPPGSLCFSCLVLHSCVGSQVFPLDFPVWVHGLANMPLITASAAITPVRTKVQ